ncbi:integral membrane protein [Aspergillus sclerotioniger CBS 115572]|uniref:Integral membrane protein n=1 Tax=Aspergillus sclerotioniger CBS 115572 TaxID=1450535 RepID=A0A317V0M7_9EURO|nr:integral membrane protein [Aspergillus sclerotioniger CBS 115572]PWY66352.1 integral membrane protein [Aspergillus sclerotioniger CBS 115572]
MATTEGYSEAYLHETRQRGLIAIIVLFIVLETLTLVLRQVSKRLGRIRLDWDDLLITLGWVLCTFVNATCLDDVYHGGVGLHQARVEQIDPGMISVWGHYIIIIPLIYFAACVPAKLAVVYLYLNIFTSKAMRMACYAVATVMLGNWFGTTVAGLLVCQPLSYFWTGVGHCINTNAFFRWSGLANLVTDCVMLVLPMPMVWNLQASLRLKLGICLTFLFGSIGLISSIFRFYILFVTNSEVDITWTAATFVLWCVVECGTYQIAACFPLYRPLVKFLGRKLHLTTSRGESGNDTANSNPRLTRSHGGRFQSLKGDSLTEEAEEDAVGLVTLGSQRSDIAPGTIVVDRRFSVT